MELLLGGADLSQSAKYMILSGYEGIIHASLPRAKPLTHVLENVEQTEPYYRAKILIAHQKFLFWAISDLRTIVNDWQRNQSPTPPLLKPNFSSNNPQGQSVVFKWNFQMRINIWYCVVRSTGSVPSEGECESSGSNGTGNTRVSEIPAQPGGHRE